MGSSYQLRTVSLRLASDSLRLRQVLGNLISNAVKFTERGEVSVKLTHDGHSAQGERLRFVVQDTGIGIPAEVLPRLFSAFQQADASTSRRYGGTGLGLALSQQLVQMLGRKIEVESVKDQGSRFFALTMPAGQRAPAQRAAWVAPIVLADPAAGDLARRLTQASGDPAS